MPRYSDIFAIKYNPIWGTSDAKKNNFGSRRKETIPEQTRQRTKLLGCPDHSPEQQEDDGAKNGDQEAGMIVAITRGPEGTSYQAADERSANAEQRCCQATHGITSGHQEPRNASDNQTDYQPADY
jgi:hypothetical protein